MSTDLQPSRDDLLHNFVTEEDGLSGRRGLFRFPQPPISAHIILSLVWPFSIEMRFGNEV